MQKKNLSLIPLFLLITGLLVVFIVTRPGDVPEDSLATEVSLTIFPTAAAPTEVVDEQALLRYAAGDVLQIHEIQGAGHQSSFTRKPVPFVTGIVTVKRADGFYMQSGQPDENELTSEGIFVYLNKPPKLEIGDLVYVNGTVTEFYPGGIETGNLSITQIGEADYGVISRNNPLPQPVVLGQGGRTLPNAVIDDDRLQEFELTDGLDFFESLEGMLVQINNAVAVAPTTAYKEIAVLADLGKDASGRNERGGITINAADFNPERIILDDSLASLPEVKTGELLDSPIVGVVDYSFGNFKIQVLQRVKGDKSGVEKEIAADSAAGELTVATYNVENLDGQDSEKRFELLGYQIVHHLKSPDIVAFQEIQDNDGAQNSADTSADQTYQKISDAIESAGGPAYTAIDIAPLPNKDGGEPGGNIRVGFMYRVDRGLELVERTLGTPEEAVQVTADGGSVGLSVNPGRIDPLNYAFVDSRKPVVVEFLYNKKKLFIINNHWNSKGGDTPLFGAIQPPRLESETQRKKQADVVTAFINEIMAVDKNAMVMVVGDLNDFYFSPPVLRLEDAEMLNLFNRLEPNERYTYIYDGNSQVLDNVLVSPALNESVNWFDVIHINAEFPYRERFSDHDPVLVRFDFMQ